LAAYRWQSVPNTTGKARVSTSLEILLQAEAIAQNSIEPDESDRRRNSIEWTAKPEKDIPQNNARQPYRSRETRSSGKTPKSERQSRQSKE